MTVQNTAIFIAGLGCAGAINYYFGNKLGVLSKITNVVLVVIGGASVEKLRREWKLRLEKYFYSYSVSWNFKNN